MKPLWTQTVAWILAVVAAILLAFASPGSVSTLFEGDVFSHGAIAPR
jgi:peptidoglycan biosynthesis protein MviN/MurJ (putative lipid II flippase)